MADIRERVVEDRGILSKIQAYIPGFSGYRKNEDLRAADNILRMQIAEKLAAIRRDVEGSRSVMLANYSLDHVERLGVLINRFKTVEQEVLHAEQGYSGISAKIQVGDEELAKLYDCDYSLVSTLVDMASDSLKLKAAASADNKPSIKESIESMVTRIDAFEATFRNRMKIATNTEV